MQLVILSAFLGVDFHIVAIVDLLLDVFVHLCGDLRFVVDLGVQGVYSFGGPVVIFTEAG